MTDITAVDQNPRAAGFAISEASVGDYIALMKPRVMSLVVFTALVGLMVTPGHLHPVLGFAALLCITIGAGAAGALNMWFDADVDAVMSRTSRRPIPAGRVLPREALSFGMMLAFGSVAVLGLVANWLAASLLAFTIFFYVAIYTMRLKRATPQNIVIGGAAGAFPPMIGWAAATGTIGLYSVLLAPVGASPWLLGYSGLLYGVTAIMAGAAMIWLSLRIKILGDEDEGDRAAKRLFGVSILYLFVLFAVLLIDDQLGAPGRGL